MEVSHTYEHGHFRPYTLHIVVDNAETHDNLLYLFSKPISVSVFVEQVEPRTNKTLLTKLMLTIFGAFYRTQVTS